MPAEIIHIFPHLFNQGWRPSCTSFGDCDVVDLRGHPLAGDRPCDVTPDRALIEEWRKDGDG